MKKVKLLAAGMSAVVAIAFLCGLILGFITLMLLILLTFLELERRETELKEISDYINLEVISYIKNNPFVVGMAFTIIGMLLLSPAILIKYGGAYWHKWQQEISWILRVLQFRLFLIAILLLAFGLILTYKDFIGSEKI